MNKPKSFDELYPGRFLKAGLLDGQKVTYTIRDVDLEELQGEDGKAKQKAILHFAETQMSLVCCKTNGVCIKAMFGARLADWQGKRVTLFPDIWNGEPCIRVWGSPDIEADMRVQVALPRRKPFERTLRRVDAGGTSRGPPKSAEQLRAELADRVVAIGAACSDFGAWLERRPETKGRKLGPVVTWSAAVLSWALRQMDGDIGAAFAAEHGDGATAFPEDDPAADDLPE